MKKIPSVFIRDMATMLLTEEVTPGCEWVLEGEGRATKKWDGTAIMVDSTNDSRTVYKRYDAKHGKTPPPGFIPCQEPDTKSGHWPGWIVADKTKPEDKWIFEALDNEEHTLAAGTYELCGPRINTNREKLTEHKLIKHGSLEFVEVLRSGKRTYESIKAFLIALTLCNEGIVYHHSDGRMAKVKYRDFFR